MPNQPRGVVDKSRWQPTSLSKPDNICIWFGPNWR